MTANTMQIRIDVRLVLTIFLMAFSHSARAQIVAFGASNVSGWNVAPSETFSLQLQAMLREKGYNVIVIKAGTYGNTTTDMRNCMDKDIPEGTTIVILDTTGGLYNDRLKGISREQGDADMAAIKDRLKARGIKVLTMSGADLPLQYHQSDGAHLTPEGHKLVAEQLLPKVTEILGPPQGSPESVRHACSADAHRLCASVLTDDEKRRACMQEHRSELSEDCLHAIAASRQH